MNKLNDYINNITAVIFDIDDTLYLERDYVRSGFMAIGNALDNPDFGHYCWSLFLDGVRGNTFDLALQKFPGTRLTIPEMVEIYRTHRPEISLCPDARRFIESLTCRTGIISDGPVSSQRAKFRALGLLPWIECPLFTGEIGISKPAPAPYQIVSRTLNTPYEQCVYIGDNPKKDFAGAKSLGMKTIRIRRPQSLHVSTPSDQNVDAELEDFSHFSLF